MAEPSPKSCDDDGVPTADIGQRSAFAALARRSFHPLGPVAAQAVAHGVNLGSQALLLASLGAELYGGIAFALVMAISALFLGELGYSSEFLRTRPPETRQRSWQIANFHRLVGSSVISGLLLTIWIVAYGPSDPGTKFLYLAIPGVILNAFNVLPLLYGEGRSRTAALSVHVRWLVHGVGMAVAATQDGSTAALFAGGAFTAGIVAQILLQVATGTSLAEFIPVPDMRVTEAVRSAGSIWMLGVLGIAADRLVFALFEWHRPEMFAAILLLLQITGGLAALVNQVERIAVPILSGQRQTSHGLARNLRIIVQAGFLLVHVIGTAILVGLWQWSHLTAVQTGIVILLLTEWYIRGVGMAIYWQVLAEGRHIRFLVRQMSILPASLALQVVCAAFVSLETALLIRVATAAVTLVLCAQVARVVPSLIDLGGLILSVVTALAFLYWI